MNLLRLGRITASPDLENKAEQIMKLFAEQIERAPTGFGQMLQGTAFGLEDTCEIVIAGHKEDPGTVDLLEVLNSQFIFNKVVVLNDPEDQAIRRLAPYTSRQTMQDDRPTAYVCRNYSCEQPVHEPEAMMKLIHGT